MIYPFALFDLEQEGFEIDMAMILIDYFYLIISNNTTNKVNNNSLNSPLFVQK
jgi:hypothetical protein